MFNVFLYVFLRGEGVKNAHRLEKEKNKKKIIIKERKKSEREREKEKLIPRLGGVGVITLYFKFWVALALAPCKLLVKHYEKTSKKDLWYSCITMRISMAGSLAVYAVRKIRPKLYSL